MTTKYTGTWRSNRWWFFSMLFLIVLVTGLAQAFTPTNNPAPSPTTPVQSVSFSGFVKDDVVTPSVEFPSPSVCTAPGRFWESFGVKKEYYKNLYLGYCTPRGDEIPATPVETLVKKIKQIVATLSPTVTVTDTPTATATQNPPTVTGTPSPTANPTEIVPTETQAPPPTEIATEKPTKTPKPEVTKTVHPNSGGGNGSEDVDGDGVDDDPGNSESHNNGND